MSKTVTVRTPLGELVAPRGFGEAYKRAAKQQAKHLGEGKPGKVIQPLRDLLRLVGYEVSTETISNWDAQRRIEAQVYAAYEHLSASDNPVQRHPRPSWFPEPWQAPWQGEGAFAGPGPTSLEGL